MKRTLQHRKGVFALLLALSLGMGTAYASYDFSVVCSTGQTLYYNITDATNQYVEITSPNASYPYWEGYTQPTGNITLPSSVTNNSVTYTVTKIGFSAFSGCSGLTGSLVIPNTVTTIDNYAFYNCTGFTGTLTIPNSVTKIGNCAFRRCSGFSGSLVIPNSVTLIDAGAFISCSGFTGTLTLGNSVTSIKEEAFDGCSGFTGSLTIPNSVTTIGNTAFSGCTGFDGTLTIGNSVTSIGQSAFSNCGFTGSLTIPNSVTFIGNSAFLGCTGFTGPLTIPNAVTAIGWYAFSNCSGFTGLLTIGSAVTTIDDYAFRNCSGFTAMTVLPETPPTLGTNAFENVPTTIPVYVPCVSLENYQTASGWSYFTNMQCPPETLTVYDGTATNNRIPAYILYFDDFARSQFVIPADDLADMAGTPITSMTFYTTNNNIPYTTVSPADVYLKEVDYTTISAYVSKASATTVYSGYFSIVSTGNGGEMTIYFSTPYTYNGGNLLVGIENTQDVNYMNIYFKGQIVSGASISGSNSSSTGTIPATQQDFIPKTTFGYTPSECSRPIDLTETDITENSAALLWTGYQDGYDLRYREKLLFFEDFEDGLPSGWTTIDNDGDGYNWHSKSGSGPYSGSTVMASASYDIDNEIVLTPDNWLITPRLELQGTMRVWIKALHPSYAQEHFAIYLSTTGKNTSDFTTVLVPETTLSGSVFTAYTADLSAYVGQQGYIAIRHFNCTNMYEILLDDFGLFDDLNMTGAWETLYNVEPSYTLTALVPDTEYEWQVRGRNCDGDGTFTEWSRAHSFVTNSLCSPEDQCELTFTLTDSYGDGWTGNAIHVVDVATNTLLASMSAPSHGLNNTSTTDTITLSVCDGRELSFEWVSGSWPSECSYTVTDNHGNEIFSGSGAMSEPVTYMVNCSGQFIFLTDGNWNDGSHWSTGNVPPAGSDVVIQANAIVPAGYLAEANEVTLDGGSITVADGGQLKHNTGGLQVTMKKNIEPYTDANDLDYYLLAFPFPFGVEVPAAMTANEGCDFYEFDSDEPNAEWRNHKQTPISTLYITSGYLYANPESIELSLTGGTLPTGSESMINISLDYTEGSTDLFNGWALLGNPYTYNAYVYSRNSDNELVPMPLMMYDTEGELQTVYGGPVAPMQGFFVHVMEETTVCFRGYALHEDDYVDLGLPSGLLWATCNVGATSPEDYGDYFAWGETTPKDTYNWSTYQYCNGSGSTLTKYCNSSSYGYNGFVDNINTLLPEDDAAAANWGNGWRMPTKEEFEELYNNTTVTWTTQNGVNGRLFTSANGNSLFLPAAGYRGNGSLDGAGGYGYYWSSSLGTDGPLDAWGLYFSSGGYGMSGYDRNFGHSVRPVCSSRQN